MDNIQVIEEYSTLSICGVLWNPILVELIETQETLSQSQQHQKRFKSNKIPRESDFNGPELFLESPGESPLDQFNSISDYLFNIWYESSQLYVESIDHLNLWRTLKSNSWETHPTNMKSKIDALTKHQSDIQSVLSQFQNITSLFQTYSEKHHNTTNIDTIVIEISSFWKLWTQILSISTIYQDNHQPITRALYYSSLSFFIQILAQSNVFSLNPLKMKVLALNETLESLDSSQVRKFMLPFQTVESLLELLPIRICDKIPFIYLLARMAQCSFTQSEFSNHFSQQAYQIFHFPAMSLSHIDPAFGDNFALLLKSIENNNEIDIAKYFAVLETRFTTVPHLKTKIQKKCLVYSVRTLLHNIHKAKTVQDESEDQDAQNPGDSNNSSIYHQEWIKLIRIHSKLWPDTEITGLLKYWSLQMHLVLKTEKNRPPWTPEEIFIQYSSFPKFSRWVLNGKRFTQSLNSKYWIQTFLSMNKRTQQPFLSEWLLDYVLWIPNFESFLAWEWAHAHHQILYNKNLHTCCRHKTHKNNTTATFNPSFSPINPPRQNTNLDSSHKSTTTRIVNDDDSLGTFGIMSLFGSSNVTVTEETINVKRPKQSSKKKQKNFQKMKHSGMQPAQNISEEEEDNDNTTTQSQTSQKKSVNNLHSPIVPGVLFIKGLPVKTNKTDIANLLLKKLSTEPPNPYLSGEMLLETIGVNKILFLDGQDMSSARAVRGSCLVSFDTHSMAINAIQQLKNAKIFPLFYNNKVNSRLEVHLCKKPSTNSLHAMFSNKNQ